MSPRRLSSHGSMILYHLTDEKSAASSKVHLCPQLFPYPSGHTQIPPPLSPKVPPTVSYRTSTIPFTTNSIPQTTKASSTTLVPTSTSKLTPAPCYREASSTSSLFPSSTLCIRGTLNYQKPENTALTQPFDSEEYELVFPDEFETLGQTFYQAETATGKRTARRAMTLPTLSNRTEPHPQLPFTVADNHNLPLLEQILLFNRWPGAWTMGKLARPGYPTTTSGMWFYTYDSCDVGTFPNQIYPTASAPASAVYSAFSKSKSNHAVSRPQANVSPLVPAPAPNKGSAVQQTAPSLAEVPSDMFQGSGSSGVSLPWASSIGPTRPADPTTLSYGKSTVLRLIDSEVGPDTSTNGTGVGQGIIPEEPMSIVFFPFLFLHIEPNLTTWK
ncbi:beta-glucan synthesis-associated protein-domain-containing protein [Amanita rubescens]|nr:beta-glucan synthesis-associated protein-domain-containing protein [Amanita rubescens]